MGTVYVDTGGNASNSGSSDNNAPDFSGAAATVAGSVVTLDGAPNLASIVTTPGPTQSSIYINDATNSNQKIFWITAVDNVLKTVTVSVAPTGVASSAWRIGGQMVWTPANVESALRPDDTVIFNNSPASRTAAFYTHRVAGSGAGYIRLKGKTGTRPVLNVTNTANVIAANSVVLLWLENLEFDQDGASGDVVNSGTRLTVINVKVSDGGANALGILGVGFVYGCELTGVLGDGINCGNSLFSNGNYIHDVGGDGIECAATDTFPTISKTIIDTAAGRGIFFSGASTTGQGIGFVDQVTVYGCGNSGLETTDADTQLTGITNSIFSENGNAAGEYNVEWAAGSQETKGMHSYNVFYATGSGGAANLLGLTANATEFTTDPLFTNAPAGDFSISSSSPAKGAGFPGQFLGGPIGYPDIGAVQRQELASGGGMRLAGHGGLAA